MRAKPLERLATMDLGHFSVRGTGGTVPLDDVSLVRETELAALERIAGLQNAQAEAGRDRQLYVVLRIIPNEKGKGWMDVYQPQLATVSGFSSPEDAACCNVGNHPDAKARGKPYRVVVVPWEHWTEYEVFSESERGRDRFRAYRAHHLSIRPASP